MGSRLLVSLVAVHVASSSDELRTLRQKIKIAVLWERVARGERFGYGDRMRVELRTTFSRDSKGRLNLERTIPRVIDVEHAIQPQANFWNDREEER